jgi:hypothetical protein
MLFEGSSAAIGLEDIRSVTIAAWLQPRLHDGTGSSPHVVVHRERPEGFRGWRPVFGRKFEFSLEICVYFSYFRYCFEEAV